MDNMNILIHPNSMENKDLEEASYVRQYFYWCKEILLEPTRFFRVHYRMFDKNEALSFGLISLWLSAFVGFVWSALNQIFIVNFLEQWMQSILFQDEAISFIDFGGKSFLFSAAYVLLNPFLSLLGLFFSALILLSLSKVFLVEKMDALEKINLQTSLKILAFSSTGAWFSLVPVFGGILSYIAVSLLTVIGVREVYKSTTRRAALVVFLPQIFLLFMVMFLLLLFGIVFFSLPWENLAEISA